MQTQDKRLDELRIAIFVSDDFEQVEMTEPYKALERAYLKPVSSTGT